MLLLTYVERTDLSLNLITVEDFFITLANRPLIVSIASAFTSIPVMLVFLAKINRETHVTQVTHITSPVGVP